MSAGIDVDYRPERTGVAPEVASREPLAHLAEADAARVAPSGADRASEGDRPLRGLAASSPRFIRETLLLLPARSGTKREQQIVEGVEQGVPAPGRTRTLDSHAARLRRKLSRTGAGPFVLNSWGVGYRLLDGV